MIASGVTMQTRAVSDSPSAFQLSSGIGFDVDRPSDLDRLRRR